jgi:amidase
MSAYHMKSWISLIGLVIATSSLHGQSNAVAKQPFSVFEASIPQMQAAMQQGRLTSRQLVTQYLTRIAIYEDKLHAAITVNPNALQEADARDRERAQGKVRGPLHGIPIAVKDNIHTIDMPTTGGALAFEGFVPPYEATLVKRLRDAGAIIIAKTGMTELANWIAGPPTPMPANYNAVSGYGLNPYDPRRDPGPATAEASSAHHWRFQLRGRHGGQLLGSQCGYGNVGVDPEPCQSKHASGY